jgi:hypothetical protein
MTVVSINRICLTKCLVIDSSEHKSYISRHLATDIRFMLTTAINQTFSQTYTVYAHYYHQLEI